ncbi:signal recognition particle subunit FFH/SRP54 (srp54) [Prosthecobacter fusiformis]|uniref:Signal recognition particle protein n=1 Tax=Prosthecobacter fusiformis TaxID=48464 RepID=A0A4R7S0Y3_9BACT|nr:signal recognition particle protein [Prosthecobacter fusiformis]TDU70617.1 signal recognition particle subunit FFH/SRP54 (srp54) [Prosthecobacter fusiformis]
MFSLLTDKLEDAFRKLRGLGKISESNVSDAMREIRMALLEADVDFKVTKELIEAVKTRALGEEVLKTVTPGQQIVKIFSDELTKILGDDAAGLDLSQPSRILMVGLNGAGKTTTSAKLAYWLKKQGKRPLLIALDLYRPAAVTQLQVLGQQLNVPVCVPAAGETDVVRATRAALAWVEQQGAGIAIFDTAGRQEVDDALLNELKKVRDLVKPGETLLVADAATGQQAVAVASKFNETVALTGLIMTKLDGDARGGSLLSMRQVTGCPVKFIGVGEKVDQLEVFHPDRMAQRILGMGDVVSLVEKAAQEIDEKEAMGMMRRMEENKFDFTDFLGQLRFMKKLGPLEGLLGMIPGMNKLKGMPGVDDNRMKHVEAIILSMTPKERSKPDIINGSRRKRISKGCGRPVVEINQLLKQFEMMRSLMKNKGAMAQMAGGLFGGGGGMGGGMPQMPKGMFPGGKMPKMGKSKKGFRLGG